MRHVYQVGDIPYTIPYTIQPVKPSEYDRSHRPTRRDWMLYRRWLANGFPKAPYLKHRTYQLNKNRRDTQNEITREAFHRVRRILLGMPA